MVKIFSQEFSCKKLLYWEFPGGPVVKNPPYTAGDMGSILVRELRSHMPRGN